MNIKNISKIIILVLIVIILGNKILKGYGENVVIKREMALEIANKEASILRYDINSVIIKIDVNNNAWKKYSQESSILRWDSKLKEKLKNRKFWAICYEPKTSQLGGDLWIFIDKDTGAIIDVIIGD